MLFPIIYYFGGGRWPHRWPLPLPLIVDSGAIIQSNQVARRHLRNMGNLTCTWFVVWLNSTRQRLGGHHRVAQPQTVAVYIIAI